MNVSYPASAAELPHNATLLRSFPSLEEAEAFAAAGNYKYAILPPSMNQTGTVVWTVFELPVEE